MLSLLNAQHLSVYAVSCTVASDSYHKYPEDIKCIEHLGVIMLVSVMIISKPKVYLVLFNFLWI